MLPVAARPVPRRDGGVFDVTDFAEITTIVLAEGGREQVAITDGFSRVRVDVVSGTLLEGPVRLEYLLSGLGDIERRILTLRRFVSLCKSGRFARGLFPAERMAPRWVAALRAHDAVRAGASQRDIARALFRAGERDTDWRQHSDFLRLRVQRLTRIGRYMARDGYRTLLR